MREFNATSSYKYVRTDNACDSSDPAVRVHWTLNIKQQGPESWSVLIGDAPTNLRAALDHAFWAAALTHCGPPARAHELELELEHR